MRQCWYCGREVFPAASSTGIDMEVIEHQTPVSRGGSRGPENMVWACASCNSRKGTRTLEEYRVYLRYQTLGVKRFTPDQLAFLEYSGFDVMKAIGPLPLFFGEKT